MALLVAALLVAERRGSRVGKWLTKPLASAAFLALALVAGATGSAYGLAVLAALVLSAIGDVLLIPAHRGVLQAGIAAFLLGHVAFIVAFALASPALPALGLAAAALLVPGVPLARWILPHVEPERRALPTAYVVVISAMVAMAVGAAAGAAPWWVALAAVAFYASDVTVARNRFVAPGFANRLVGLPLYYGAQAALAWSVATFT